MTRVNTAASPDLRRRKSVFQKAADSRTLILMCLPAILFFFVFSYLPMPGSYVAFTRFDYGKGIFASEFIRSLPGLPPGGPGPYEPRYALGMDLRPGCDKRLAAL